jgi:hypothetical protein
VTHYRRPEDSRPELCLPRDNDDLLEIQVGFFRAYMNQSFLKWKRRELYSLIATRSGAFHRLKLKPDSLLHELLPLGVFHSASTFQRRLSPSAVAGLCYCKLANKQKKGEKCDHRQIRLGTFLGTHLAAVLLVFLAETQIVDLNSAFKWTLEGNWYMPLAATRTGLLVSVFRCLG